MQSNGAWGCSQDVNLPVMRLLRVAQAELGGAWALYLLDGPEEGRPVAVVLPVGAGVEGSQPLPRLQEVWHVNELYVPPGGAHLFFQSPKPLAAPLDHADGGRT